MIWFTVALAAPAETPAAEPRPTIPVFAPTSSLEEPMPAIPSDPAAWGPPTSDASSDPPAPDTPPAPVPQGPSTVVTNTNPVIVQTNPLQALVPHRGARGIRAALGLGFAAALFGAFAAVLRRLGTRFKPSGIVPAGLRVVELIARTMVAIFGLGVVAALLPAFIAPVVPVVLLAGAVAVGWSARDIVTDLVAGLFVGVEGQLRAGSWIQGERYAGTVETIGLRVTWLRDVHGRRIVVPNRVLLAQPLVADDSPWPRIQFTVTLHDGDATRIRAALDEAIVLSPWVAPEPDMEVHPDAKHPGHWQVAVRLLDGKYADRFQGNLRERVDEILAASAPNPLG